MLNPWYGYMCGFLSVICCHRHLCLQAALRGHSSPLPGWLENTFCALESGHPLRTFLSPSKANKDPVATNTLNKSPSASRQGSTFVFSPSNPSEDAPNPLSTNHQVPFLLSFKSPITSTTKLQPSSEATELITTCLPSKLQHSTPCFFAPNVRPSNYDTVLNPTVRSVLCLQTDEVDSASRAVCANSTGLVSRSLDLSIFKGSTFLQRHDFPFENDPMDLSREDDLLYTSEGLTDCGTRSVHITSGPAHSRSHLYHVNPSTGMPRLAYSTYPEDNALILDDVDFRWQPFLRTDSKLESHFRQGRHVNPPQLTSHVSFGTTPGRSITPVGIPSWPSDYPAPASHNPDSQHRDRFPLNACFMDEAVQPTPLGLIFSSESPALASDSSERSEHKPRKLASLFPLVPRASLSFLQNHCTPSQMLQRQSSSTSDISEEHAMACFSSPSSSEQSSVLGCMKGDESRRASIGFEIVTPPRQTQTSQPTTPRKARANPFRYDPWSTPEQTISTAMETSTNSCCRS